MVHQTSLVAVSRPRRIVYHHGDIYSALSQLLIDNNVEDKEDNEPGEQPILCVGQYKEAEKENEDRDQDEYDDEAVDLVSSE
uniref:Histone deacetylase 14 n=1 Tax=Angiostrongylus cantonensis TaxID=6313 RepID=A0A0K0DAG1_ANGCA